MNSISHNLKNLRKANGWTQQQMAEKLSVTHQTISNWESGRSMPNMDTLADIAGKLGTDVKYLLYGKKADKGDLKNAIIKSALFFAITLVVNQMLNHVYTVFSNNGIYPYMEAVDWYYYIPSTIYGLVSACSYILGGQLAGQLLKYYGFISIDNNKKFYRLSGVFSKVYTSVYVVTRIITDIMHVYTKAYKKYPDFVVDIWRKPFNFFIDYFWSFILIGFVLELSKPYTADKITLPVYSPGRTNTIAKNIKRLRIKLSLTQQQMADKLFVTRQTISNWENGKIMPDVSALLNIAGTFDTDLNEILYSEKKISKKEILSTVFTGLVIVIVFCLYRGMWWSSTTDWLTRYSIWNAGTIYMSLKTVLYFPVLWFAVPVFIVRLYNLTGALKIQKKLQYRNIVRIVIVLFMVLTFYNYLPYFFTVDLKETLHTAKPLLWLNYPDFSFIPSLPKSLSHGLYMICQDYRWLYSILGIVYAVTGLAGFEDTK